MNATYWKDYLNKLTYGDSRDLLKELPDKSVDLILTDPPYDFTLEQQAIFHYEFERVCKGAILVFSPPENQWMASLEDPNQYLFWIKPISTKNTSKSYSRFVEMILLFGRGSWNTHRHWSQYTNVFTDLVDERLHAFRKPPSLLERLILNHSNPADIVLDPFAGSGTVGKVAYATQRSHISFEIGE